MFVACFQVFPFLGTLPVTLVFHEAPKDTRKNLDWFSLRWPATTTILSWLMILIRDFSPNGRCPKTNATPGGRANERTEKTRRTRECVGVGAVIVSKNANSKPTSLQARYVNLLDPSKKVSRNFRLEYQAEAYRWLDEEH